jgi:hypothetical protein
VYKRQHQGFPFSQEMTGLDDTAIKIGRKEGA